MLDWASQTRRALISITCLVIVAAVTAETAQRQRRGRNRDAQQRQEIERTIELLGLKAGEAVAEIGAGDGQFSLRFAEVVGPNGRVYANELDADDVARIRRSAERADLDNLVAVRGAVDDTKLPDGCCDAMMMRRVYHMMTNPVPMSESFFRALKPGGRLAILEGDPEPGRRNADGVPSNRSGMGIDPQIVIDELADVGFVFDRHVEDWSGADYALLFHKPGTR
jgi:predicted methyltransferase